MNSKRIFDVFYADARAADKNAYDVESVVFAGQSVPIDPDLGGATKLPLLMPVDGFDGITELDPCPGLDLYERD